MRDQSNQEQFGYYWGKGAGNRADYWTKLVAQRTTEKLGHQFLHQQIKLTNSELEEACYPINLGLVQGCAKYQVFTGN